MNITKLCIAIVALLIGGWFTLDGTRALRTGNYFTPRSGPGAGQLGPWSKVVASAGIDPQSRFMKSAHVVLGVCWLLSLAAFLMGLRPGWYALAGCATLSLWYLPIGTLLGIIELVLLMLPQVRQLK